MNDSNKLQVCLESIGLYKDFVEEAKQLVSNGAEFQSEPLGLCFGEGGCPGSTQSKGLASQMSGAATDRCLARHTYTGNCRGSIGTPQIGGLQVLSW